MRIGVAATPLVAIPTLDWLFESEYELSQIISTPDQPSARGKKLEPSAVSQWATKRNLPCLATRDFVELRECFAKLDLIVVIGFGAIFPPELINAPKYGCINVHFSLLPQWRGAAPVQRALMNGETNLGVSVFQITEGIDTGPVYSTASVIVDTECTYGDALERLSVIGVKSVAMALEMIRTGQLPVEQASGAVSLAPKISRQDARIDWKLTAQIIHNLVRGVNPEPGAWTLWRGEPMQIRKSSITHAGPSLSPGEIGLEGGSFFVGCAANQNVEILSLIPAGKREMSAAQWSNGARIISGDRFE